MGLRADLMQMPPRPGNVDLLRDLFAKRVRLMDDWAKFCALPSRKGNVSNIRDAAPATA